MPIPKGTLYRILTKILQHREKMRKKLEGMEDRDAQKDAMAYEAAGYAAAHLGLGELDDAKGYIQRVFTGPGWAVLGKELEKLYLRLKKSEPSKEQIERHVRMVRSAERSRRLRLPAGNRTVSGGAGPQGL